MIRTSEVWLRFAIFHTSTETPRASAYTCWNAECSLVRLDLDRRALDVAVWFYLETG